MDKNKIFLFSVAIVSGLFMSLYFTMTKDDTFIFLQFVRNMLSNQEMSFNAGEPTYGFTSVLWTLLLFSAGKINSYLLINAKLLSFACSIGSIYSFYYLCTKILNDKKWQMAATAAFAINPVFVYISFSGMETPLAIMLVVTGVGVYIDERDKTKILYWSPVLFALSYLTRPEMLLLIVLAIFDIFINAKNKNKIKMIAIFILQYVFVIVPWLAIAYYHFGTIIPNPVIIKAVQSTTDYTASYITKRLLLIFGSIHTAEVLLIIGSCIFVFKNKKTDFIIKFFKQNLLIVLWIAGLLGSYVFQKVSVSPRYLLIISPFIVVIAFVFMEYITTQQYQKNVKAVFLITALLFLGQTLVATTQIYYPHAQSYNKKDLALKDVALWLNDNAPENSSVASIDIGILGYFSGRKVVDLTGLINPEKIKTPLTIDYLKEKKVEYLLDRHPVPYYMAEAKINYDKWDLDPVIYRSAPSRGWHYNLVENKKIGFSLYHIKWK